jgi:UPF0271 protein
MDCTPGEVRDFMIYQIGALQGFCTSHGVRLQHVKPHGSLYNMCVGNEVLSRAIAEAIAAVSPDLLWVTLGGAQAGLARKVADTAGIRVVFEAFPDRAYTPDGKLAPRSFPGAVIEDPKLATEQAIRMARDNAVIATDGTLLKMEVHTLCVHGDNPSAVHHVMMIRQALEAEGLRIASLDAPF